MIYAPPPVNHLKTLEDLRSRLAILKGSPHPEHRTEEISQVESVIATYTRLYQTEGP